MLKNFLQGCACIDASRATWKLILHALKSCGRWLFNAYLFTPQRAILLRKMGKRIGALFRDAILISLLHQSNTYSSKKPHTVPKAPNTVPKHTKYNDSRRNEIWAIGSSSWRLRTRYELSNVVTRYVFPSKVRFVFCIFLSVTEAARIVLES